MAGPRKGDFVSLPLGPGVLSNPTGRGAHTRIAFQNWDRWVDSNWVRWHKLLPEKRGGWAYQPLAAAVPSAPSDAPQLILTFDGPQGSNQIVDSSINGTPITNNGGTSSPTGVTLDDTTYKIGSASGFFAGPSSSIPYWTVPYLTFPVIQNGPLDLDIGDFTIEFWFNMRGTQTWGSTGVIFNYGPWVSTPAHGFMIQLGSGYNGTTQVMVQFYSPVSSILSTQSIPLDTWTHVALVRYGGVMSLYANGTEVANTQANLPANFNFGAAPVTVHMNYDYNQGANQDGIDGWIDNFLIYKYAKYTQNFTPGTAPTPTLIAPGIYLGLARALADWSSLDEQLWIATGTHLKAYITDLATLYDITPSRKSSNLTNALTTVLNSPTVTVVDTDHRANDGDYITIIGSSMVGGLELDGEYPITFVDDDSYTITAPASATSAQTGGGSFTIRYDIYPGLPSNGQLLGYGTGPYGQNEYGTPRPAGTGVPARLRTWSMDNYGEDLILSPSDGGIYWWQRQYGPSTIAALLPNSPDGCQRVLIDKNRQSLIAFGCTDVTGAYNSMLVRWPDINDFTDWAPSDVNDAGSQVLQGGSRIITALNTKSQALCFTDTTIFRVIPTGTTQVYEFVPSGDCWIVGPEAGCDVDGVAMFMGFDNFYSYEGTLQVLNCEVWETVFDPSRTTSLLRSQSEKVVCYTYEPKTEITWIYPSIGGSGECDRYVTFNWDDEVWYYGSWNRTCARGRSAAMQGGYPYSVTNGYLYQDEVGIDAVEPTGTTGIAFSMRTLDITTGGKMTPQTMGGSDARFLVGGSDSRLLVRHMVPDFAYFTGSMNLTLLTKERPQQSSYLTWGPVEFGPTDDQIDIDAKGSQLVIELDNMIAPPPNNVIALLALDGGAGSTSFPDLVNDLNFAAAGAAAVSSVYSNFSQNVLYCPNAPAEGRDYVAAPLTGTLAANVLLNNFTIECFFLFPSANSGVAALFDYGNVGATPNNGFAVQLQAGNPPYDTVMTTGGLPMAGADLATTLTLGVWHHLALTKSSGAVTLWLDGARVGAVASWPDAILASLDPQRLTIGGSPLGNAWGPLAVSEFRITNDEALYTAPFTPPNAPFPVPVLVPQPAPGTSFRMGIWQGFAVPYGTR